VRALAKSKYSQMLIEDFVIKACQTFVQPSDRENKKPRNEKLAKPRKKGAREKYPFYSSYHQNCCTISTINIPQKLVSTINS